MNILVTGANGQLGSEIKALKEKYAYQFTFTDVEELDITKLDKLEVFIKKNRPDVVINCAAYTAVDKAESEVQQVNQVNFTAVKNIAELSSQYKYTVVHFSTDYVFDGKNSKPYTENDTANPKTIYGKSKFNGEIEIVFNAHKALIFRTSWLYSSFGNNFVKTILKLAKEKKELKVVADQVGCPTYAKDLAKAVLDVIPHINYKDKCEIFNYSNEGVASWYDFSKAIVELSGVECKIFAIDTKEYPTPATRPFYSVLNKSKFKNFFKIEIPYWRDSLKECLKEMNELKH